MLTLRPSRQLRCAPSLQTADALCMHALSARVRALQTRATALSWPSLQGTCMAGWRRPDPVHLAGSVHGRLATPRPGPPCCKRAWQAGEAPTRAALPGACMAGWRRPDPAHIAGSMHGRLTGPRPGPPCRAHMHASLTRLC
eukprot:361905-Chlamydomonas_euryale.AAC.5